LIEEAKKDTNLTQQRIENFYKWLQGETIEGYKPRKKKTKASLLNEKRGIFYNNSPVIAIFCFSG